MVKKYVPESRKIKNDTVKDLTILISNFCSALMNLELLTEKLT